MISSIAGFFSAEGFMPHGMCYLWRPDVLVLHATSDAVIALAYFSIPLTLLYFVRQRKDLEFSWIFVCFAIFIVACGTTHIMEILTIWEPAYWVSGMIKAITALASIITLMEVTGLAAELISESFRAIEILIVAAAIYLFINFTVTRLVQWAEYALSADLRPPPAAAAPAQGGAL